MDFQSFAWVSNHFTVDYSWVFRSKCGRFSPLCSARRHGQWVDGNFDTQALPWWGEHWCHGLRQWSAGILPAVRHHLDVNYEVAGIDAADEHRLKYLRYDVPGVSMSLGSLDNHIPLVSNVRGTADPTSPRDHQVFRWEQPCPSKDVTLKKSFVEIFHRVFGGSTVGLARGMIWNDMNFWMLLSFFMSSLDATKRVIFTFVLGLIQIFW